MEFYFSFPKSENRRRVLIVFSENLFFFYLGMVFDIIDFMQLHKKEYSEFWKKMKKAEKVA